LTYFDLVFILTGGGPGNSTRILPLDMYLTGFRSYQMGPASVIAVILVAVGLTLSLVLNRASGADRMESQMEGAGDEHENPPLPQHRRRPAGLRLAAGDHGADLLHRRHQRAAARGLLLLEPAVAAHRVHARAVPLRAGERLPALLRELGVRHGAHRAGGGDRLAAGLLRDRALPHPPGAVPPEAVPDGDRDPAAGHDHPGLLPDRAAGAVRHPVGADPAVDRLRHSDHRADPDELPAGRAGRAVRVDDGGRRLGLADVPLPGAAAGEARRGHRRNLRRAAG